MSRISKQKSGHLHVEAFNLATRDLLAKQSEKNFEELNRVITALSEVRNPQVWNLEDREVASMLLNCAQIIYQIDPKHSVVWHVVELLTHVAKHSDPQAMVAKFQLMPVLARLLHDTIKKDDKKTIKLLELIQMLAEDFEVLSVESYLITMAQDLEAMILQDQQKIQLLAGVIFSTLLRKNIFMVKILMSHCTLSQLTSLRPPDTEQISLVLESLEMRVNQFNLNSPSPQAPVLAKIITRLAVNVDISYKNDNYMMIRFYNEYLEDLGQDSRIAKGLKSLDTTEALSKLLEAANFTKTPKPALWENYFHFLTTFVSVTAGDSIITFNCILKIVLKRLEIKPYKETSSALELLCVCLKSMKVDETDPTDKLNLKLQIEQILPGLANILMAASSSVNSCEIKTAISCLKLLDVIQDVEPVTAAALGNVLTADKIYTAVMKDMQQMIDGVWVKDHRLKARLALNFISLTDQYAAISDPWAAVKKKLDGASEVYQCVADGVKEVAFDDKEEMSRALKLLVSHPSLLNNNGRKASTEKETNTKKNVVLPEFQPKLNYLEIETTQRVEQCMDEISQAARNLSLEEEERVLPHVLQLQQYFGQEERVAMARLQESLEMADARIQAANKTIQHYDQQVCQLKSMLSTVSGRYTVAQEELRVTRAQHNTISCEARSQINQLQDNLDTRTAEWEEERSAKEEALEANDRMKKDIADMNSRLKALIEDRESQEAHLKETKAALAKRDDKLKRTLKQLEEASCKNDESGKKIEKLEKSNKSLEILVKNQEEAIGKKEKQIQESHQEIEDLRRVRDAIFNLSKSTTSAGSG